MQAEVRARYFIQAVTIMIPINTISQKIKKVNKNRKLKHLPTLFMYYLGYWEIQK
jgi:hypothetical protein